MTPLQKMPERDGDKALITMVRVRQAVSALDHLGDWLAWLPPESKALTDADRGDLVRAYQRLAIMLGGDLK